MSGRLYTTTGSFTMCSFLSSRASTQAMMFDFSFGVAVIERMKLGLTFFSISIDSSLLALWLSSTITTGRSWRMTWMSAVSGVSARISSLFWKYSANFMRLPFSW